MLFNGVCQAAGAGSFPSWSAQGSLDGDAVRFENSLRRLSQRVSHSPVKVRDALLCVLPLVMPL